MNDVLYVGGDDSNHAGDAKGEFIVATFSLKYEDSIVKIFPNRRNNQEVNSWLEEGGDYRFTICTGEVYKSSQNLPKVIPILIEKYLHQTDLKIRIVKTYLDGRLEGEAKKEMRKDLLEIEGIEKVVINNFIKKRRIKKVVKKGYYCPRLVWLADTLANNLYGYDGPVSDLLNHSKMVRSLKL